MNKLKKITYISLFVLIILLALIVTLFLVSTDDNSIHTKINSISTWLLTILTLTYVALTYFILNSNKKLIEEQNRPFVILSFPSEGIKLYMSIKNIGNRPAYHVKISTKPSLGELIDSSRGTFDDSIAPILNQNFLAPNYDLTNFISVTPKILKLSSASKNIDISISYRDSNNHKYQETYQINLENEIFEKKSQQSETIESRLKSVNDTLVKIYKIKELSN